jgi:UDP-N-acetyl-2-amino-2-deoxyglucuronate dehydrogenase
VEDLACASVRFASGALASIQADLVSRPGMALRVIAGDRGTLVLDGTPRLGTQGAGVLDFIRGREDTKVKAESVWEDLEDPGGEGGHPYLIRDFVGAIREDRPPFVPGEDGRRALELTNAMLFSGLTGRSVTLPLDRDAYDRLMEDLVEGRVRLPGYDA